MSNPPAGGVRVTQQTARLTSLLGNSAPVPSSAQYPSSLLQEASPARRGYEDLGRQGTRRLPWQQTLVAPSVIFFMSLGPHIGAQHLCACPLSAIKGEACDVTHTSNLRLTQTLTSSYKLSSNTSHSGVGCYAPAARTTLNPCVFFPLFQLTSKTLRPLLIFGFRAGALRHPAGDLLSDNHLPYPAPSLPLRSTKSARSIVRCLYAILAFQSALLYFL
jgi:hypothetical protein